MKKPLLILKKVGKEQSKLELSITSLYEISDVWYKEGAYQIARDKYAELASLYPKLDMADLVLYEAGYISFYNLNDIDSALKYFLELEEKFANREIARYAKTKKRVDMAADLRGQGYKLLKEKKYTEAREYFKKAIEIAPLDVGSLNGLVLCFYWMNERGEALNNIKKVLEIAPLDVVSSINSLFFCINSEKVNDAIKTGEEFLSRKMPIKRAEFYYNLGYAYVLKADIDKAIIHFERAIKLNPDFVFAYNNLGCAFWSVEKYTKAIEMFKKAIAIDPDYADAHFNLGVSYFCLKRLEDAHPEFKKALNIDSNYKQAEEYLGRIREVLKYEP